MEHWSVGVMGNKKQLQFPFTQHSIIPTIQHSQSVQVILLDSDYWLLTTG
jgi:hypothetical protein